MEPGGGANVGKPPAELLAAVASALERERGEGNAEERARILAGIRATVDGWLRGRMTTAQAVVLLRVAAHE